jgi:hypothetical protein
MSYKIFVVCFRFIKRVTNAIFYLTQDYKSCEASVLLKLAKAFNVSIDFLVGEGKLSSLDKDVLKRIEEIEQLDSDTRKHLFFLIDNVIQNFKTKRAFE